MNNHAIIELLSSKHVRYLYHANTVCTSLTFLSAGGLLSREAVETRALAQTPQQSDTSDRQFGIYDALFFDSDDNHERAGKRNPYGPVLFLYDPCVLSLFDDSQIRISRKNALYWKSSWSDAARYLKPDEYDALFRKGEFDQSIILFGQEEPLPLSYVRKIIYDFPIQKGEAERLISDGWRRINAAAKQTGLEIPIVRRGHAYQKKHCECMEQYRQLFDGDRAEFEKLFSAER